jgi:leucyl aminopeptidase
MKIQLAPSVAVTPRAEIVIGFAFDKEIPDLGPKFADAVKAAKATGDLTTKERAFSMFHQGAGVPAKRIGFVGMGKRQKSDTERLRRAAAVAQAKAEGLEVEELRLSVQPGDHDGVEAFAAGAAIAEGLVLGAYRYEPPRREKPKPRHALKTKLAYGGTGAGAKAFADGVRHGIVAAEATVFARELENQPANVLTPSQMAAAARKLAGSGITVEVLGVREMKKLGMNSLLGVAQGSAEPPKLIVLDHRPRGAKKTVCVVGKGLTFDTGGISIKPAAKMDEMRYDMCGGGAVLGLFHALRNGGLRGAKDDVRIVGMIAAVENMPDGKAQRPGDVVRAMNGTTIEVLNTDAEGRLVLADALSYAVETFAPAKIVDLATLTGAVVTALGHEVAGIMGNDARLIAELIAAGKAADEPLWELPLWDVHKKQMESKFADIANINGPNHGNGSIAGGAFLSFFVGDTPWAHIDIAGTAWGGIAKDYYKNGAAGTAVRTLLSWLRGAR